MSERQRKRATTETIADLVMPAATNIVGTMYGGDVLKHMDMAASLAALRFARKSCVTASTDAVDFHEPIRPGHIVEFNARVVLTGNTSMVIKIEVYGEEPLSAERYHCCTAFFTFVALGPGGKPSPVPELIIETPEEIADAERARQVRAASKERIKLAGEVPVMRTLDRGAH
ncbi:MAG: acyl-CoA thioesterase [bacterium]|jgi:acyl-CoA hydrolase